MPDRPPTSGYEYQIPPLYLQGQGNYQKTLAANHTVPSEQADAL